MTERVPEAARQAGLAMTSQALTMALFAGNPAAQILGAAVPTALDLAVRAGAAIRMKVVAWMDRTVTLAAWDAGKTRDEFIQQMTASEAGPSLYYRVMIAAGASRLEDKIRGFAYALQLGVTEPERLDEAYLLVEALEAIELPHVEVLSIIRRRELEHPAVMAALPDDEREVRKNETGATGPEALDGELPRYEHVREALVSRLLQLGLIRNEGLNSFFGTRERWSVTRLGIRCLDLLHSSSADAAPEA